MSDLHTQSDILESVYWTVKASITLNMYIKAESRTLHWTQPYTMPF